MLCWAKKINWTLTIAVVGLLLGLINTIKPLFEKPSLKGEMQHIVAGDIIPPVKIDQQEYPCSLVIYFYVTNYSTKPVRLLNNYKLYIVLKKSKFDLFAKKIEAKPYYFNPDTVFHFVEGKQPGGFNFKRDYLLSKDNLDPVVYGGIVKGLISFVCPITKEKVMRDGTEFLLLIQDVFRREHKIKYTFSGNRKGPMFFPISQMTTP